jgi:excisionase family DNA binding protein
MTDTPSAALGRFLTVADAAEVLRITAADVLDLVRSGELPAIPIGSARQWRIERDVLETYIEAMYEQARRMSLWHQGDLADLLEFAPPLTESDQRRY